jgi:hypothetical protein
VFAQIVHVEVAVLLEPVLVRLDRQCPHQPQAALAIGKMRTTWVCRKLGFETIEPYYDTPVVGTIFMRRSLIEHSPQFT